jgi:endonuclease III related protein
MRDGVGRDRYRVNRRRQELLQSIFARLHAAFGPQNWWPAETPFEMILGAILTQNTAWKNVAVAIENLRENKLLSFEGICEIPAPRLAALIRSSGFYNQKTKKIKGFCEHVLGYWEGDLEKFLSRDAEELRSELLEIRGIGRETADSIILYAAFKPSFVVDAYTYRIFFRHGWVPESISYEDLWDYFMETLEPDVAFFQEFHALLVRTGHLFCRKKPLCESCPLNTFLDNRE